MLWQLSILNFCRNYVKKPKGTDWGRAIKHRYFLKEFNTPRKHRIWKTKTKKSTFHSLSSGKMQWQMG
jgi:hypothetical protein